MNGNTTSAMRLPESRNDSAVARALRSLKMREADRERVDDLGLDLRAGAGLGDGAGTGDRARIGAAGGLIEGHGGIVDDVI